MKLDDFVAWAAERGLSSEAIEQLVCCSATDAQMKSTYDAVLPPPPIYTLHDIKGLTDDDPYGISPMKHGFMIVGGCPNGDPIALDVEHDVGSVWYIGHETMHEAPLRSISIRVADDLREFIDRLINDDDFPIDYFQAKQQHKTTQAD